MKSTRRVAISATIAALYFVFTVAFNPISFGPYQFRVANVLMALMFFDVDYCYGLAFGIFLGNLTSPFGPLDWLIMPVISLGAALTAYWMRRYWYAGLVVWALITSAGVSFFPLGVGAHLPFWTTLPFILVAQLIAGYLGYGMWRPFKKLIATQISSRQD
jgi:uncharacterized membrane protein